MSSVSLNDRPSADLIRSMVMEGFASPMLFHGFINDWEIMSWDLGTWSEKLGNKALPFRSGIRRVTKCPQWEAECEKVNLTLREFLASDSSVKSENKENDKWLYFDYKYMNEWFAEQLEVLNAVSWKNFGFPERGGAESTLWIGNDGAHTPCHMDTYGCNLVAQVYGRFKSLRNNQIYSYLQPSDDESRLQEALVRFFISQICKDLSEQQQLQLLNPNEVDLLDNPVSDTTQYIDIWRNKCKSNKEEDEPVKKKVKLSDVNDDCSHSGRLSVEEFLNNYKESIKPVPKYTTAEFKHLLKEKWNRFGEEAVLTTQANKNTIHDIVNAFCHPDVISKVKDMLL
ncbi:hypothetical protein C0J52_03590 [Blattella germanica]|nr:hypothetical protein C0J52_03590 [Blattella germanica]